MTAGRIHPKEYSCSGRYCVYVRGRPKPARTSDKLITNANSVATLITLSFLIYFPKNINTDIVMKQGKITDRIGAATLMILSIPALDTTKENTDITITTVLYLHLPFVNFSSVPAKPDVRPIAVVKQANSTITAIMITPHVPNSSSVIATTRPAWL